MAEILTIAAVLQGQQNYTWPSFAVGETVNLNLICIDPSTGGALNLSGAAVVWTVTNRFTGATVVSRQATVTSQSGGLATVPIVVADTAPGNVPIAPGLYNADCWAEDVSGNRLGLAQGNIFLAPCYRIPNGAVTVPATQSPLGQGPPGIGLNYVFKSGAYSAAFLDQVVGDPTSGAFNVTLPLISTLQVNAGGLISVVHGSTSTNTIGVLPSGADKILIAGSALTSTTVSQAGVLRLNPAVDVAHGNRWVSW